jgi:Uma2 family endonuclease
MKKFSVIFLIVFLILSTALVKNSTKRTDDEIFTIKENIRALKKEFENIKLEYEFLSSTEKLLEFQNLYFDDELAKKGINEIKIIDQSTKQLQINNLILGNE